MRTYLHSIFIILFFCVFTSLFAGGEKHGGGARQQGIANADITISDAFALFSNQAGIADLEKFSGGISYENRFTLKELAIYSGAFVLPTKSGSFGISVQQFGFNNYTEQKIGLAYARKLSDKIKIGAQIDYIGINIPEYDRSNVFTFELGIIAQPIDELKIGAHIYNPIRAKSVDGERLSTIIELGASYHPSDKVMIIAEVEKDLDLSPRIKTGIEYHAFEAIYLRAGFRSGPNEATFGFGVKLEKIRLDVSSAYHSTLGFSPSIGLTYGLE